MGQSFSLAYAALYKSYGEKVDCIKANDITISIICWAKPQKVFQYFDNRRIKVENRIPGIYVIRYGFLFPLQIIVSKELNHASHTWLCALSNEMDADEFSKLMQNVKRIKGTKNDELVKSVLRVSLKANKDTVMKIKEEKGMWCEELEELMEPELTQKWNDGQRNGAIAVLTAMNSCGYSSDEIATVVMKAFNLNPDEAIQYLKNEGQHLRQ